MLIVAGVADPDGLVASSEKYQSIIDEVIVENEISNYTNF